MARVFVATNSEYLADESISNPWSALPMTIGCWMNVQAFVNGTIVYGFGGAGSTNVIQIQTRATAGARVIIDTATNMIVATGLTANVWSWVLAQCNTDGTCDMRFDGVSQATATGGILASIDRVRIGVRSGSSPTTGFADVTVAECAAWNVYLSADEDAALAAGISPLLVRPNALVYYDPMIRGASPTGGDSFDIIGGATLTDNNTVTVADHPPMLYAANPYIITAPAAAAGLTVAQMLPATQLSTDLPPGWDVEYIPVAV